MESRRRTGARYEELAAEYLEEKGYVILERNFRCRSGEIDLIASIQDQIVFVEVKYRSVNGKGSPEEAVDRRKQRTISRCALFYLTRHPDVKQQVRFDVIAISDMEIRHYEHAFEYID